VAFKVDGASGVSGSDVEGFSERAEGCPPPGETATACHLFFAQDTPGNS